MVSEVPAYEALGKLEPAEREAVERFRDEVRLRWGPRVRDIRLFGSKARGDDHDESDIDLLVLLDDLDEDMRKEVSRLAWKIYDETDPGAVLMAHTFDFEKYHLPTSRATGFYKEIRKESVRL